jgi:hypothetical protein
MSKLGTVWPAQLKLKVKLYVSGAHKRSFRKPLVKGRKFKAPDIFNADTLCEADTGNNSLFS